MLLAGLGIASTADAGVVGIKQPRAGSTIAGKTPFNAKVAGHARSVSFYVDGKLRWTDRSKPFVFGRHGRVDVSRLSRGVHRLSIEVRYGNGVRRRASSQVHVVRGSASAVGTPPKVAWKAPVAGQSVRGLLTGSTCEATASDTDMSEVQFYLDGKVIRLERNAPYNCVWDTTKSAEGSHTLKAVAVDKAGNKSTTSIAVKVANKSQPTSSSSTPTGSTPAPSTATGSLLWNGDFETGSFSQWEGVFQAVPGRASIVTSPRIQGNYAARLEARAGEFIGSDSSPAPGRNRTELIASPVANRHNPKEGDEFWYRWYFYLPSETPLPLDGTSEGMTILQWTTAASGDVPGWEQLGIFQFRDTKASGDPGPGHVEFLYTDSGSRADGTEHFWRKAATAVTRNTWHKLLIHKRWSSKSDGFVEINFDGVQQTLTDGTTRMYMRTLTPGYSARMQHGIYRGNAIGGNAVIYSDGFRIGTTREAVDN